MSTTAVPIVSQKLNHTAARPKKPFNISVYGNPVLDVIAEVGEGAINATGRNVLEKVAKIQTNGSLNFRPNTYLGYRVEGERIVWGPFNPSNAGPVRYVKGRKYRVPLHSGEAAERIISQAGNNAASFPSGIPARIGGGGPNVLFGFYDVFAALRVELVATVEKRGVDTQGRLDNYVTALTEKIGDFTAVPIYDYPGINLSIEGLGYPPDRIIFTARIPRDGESEVTLPRPKGAAVMVNTLYSPRVAIDALAHACAESRHGLLALTTSLCSKQTVDSGIFQEILARHGDLRIDDPGHFDSVYDFIVKFVLPQGRCICVANEDELQHLTGIPTYTARGDEHFPTLGGMVAALKQIRALQSENRPRIYATAGPAGSFVVDENDELVYCAVVEDQQRPRQGKTAIGDTFATFLLALETIGHTPACSIIKAAAAGADSGVYDGFGHLAVNKVNRYLGEPKRRLVSLGNLHAFPCDTWASAEILSIPDSSWDTLAKDNFMLSRFVGGRRRFVPTTLQEIIERMFLKLEDTLEEEEEEEVSQG